MTAVAYDEGLAERLRAELGGGVVEKKMFGGLAFLLGGNMAVGVLGEELLVRLDPEHYDACASEAGAHPFVMGGRTSKGWLLVAPDAIAEDRALQTWVARGTSYASSLPPK